MSVRVGINGFGRIGRNFYRAAKEQGADIEIVAVNDLGGGTTMAHLLEYDSVMGQLDADVDVTDDGLSIDGKQLKVLSERDPPSCRGATSASTWSSSRPASSPTATRRPPTSTAAPRS
jgi:glyceraldehyde-3-phosphate dehydrogenase/erythrose-4-phosphate dehydrogenase